MSGDEGKAFDSDAILGYPCTGSGGASDSETDIERLSGLRGVLSFDGKEACVFVTEERVLEVVSESQSISCSGIDEGRKGTSGDAAPYGAAARDMARVVDSASQEALDPTS